VLTGAYYLTEIKIGQTTDYSTKSGGKMYAAVYASTVFGTYDSSLTRIVEVHGAAGATVTYTPEDKVIGFRVVYSNNNVFNDADNPPTVSAEFVTGEISVTAHINQWSTFHQQQVRGDIWAVINQADVSYSFDVPATAQSYNNLQVTTGGGTETDGKGTPEVYYTFNKQVLVRPMPLIIKDVIHETTGEARPRPIDVNIGQDVIFRLTVRNTGPSVYENIVVADLLPQNLTFAGETLKIYI
jgi:uncharacterized repeat protein (TIGR01451 family)